MFKCHDYALLEISGKYIDLEFYCGTGPWIPTGHCDLDDLKNETGVDFPLGVILVIETDGHFNTDFIYEVFIEKSMKNDKLIIHYELEHEYDDSNFGELGSSYIQSYGGFERYMDLEDNIYETITRDLEIFQSRFSG